MYIIEVIPLTILPPNMPQVLSYFFDKELQKGAIVEISLNKRKIKAVVLSSNSLKKEKLALKKVDFQIKKINKVLYEKPQVNNYQLKIASWIAKYYHAPLGYTLKTILPPFVFKKKYLPIQSEQSLIIESRILDSPTKPNGLGRIGALKPQLIIYNTRKLVKYLGPLVKDVIKSQQVLILVPEKSSINYFYDYLSCPASSPPLIPLRDWRSADKLGAGSKKYNTSVIFSGSSNEKQYNMWRKIQLGETSVIIGTRQALNMQFCNLGLIIVDDPNNEAYKSDMTPRYNAVKLAHKIAELNNARLVLTSVIPSVEDHYKIKIGLYEFKKVESRPYFDVEIIDTAQEIKNGNWSPISKKLSREIIARLANNQKVLIFSPRRGYAGIVICSNCGSAIKCPRCDVAMRTHQSIGIILICHHCETSGPIPSSCSVCGSRNLKTVGPAGTQKIYEEIKTKLVNEGIESPILILDTDVVKNETEEEEIISEISNPLPTSRASVLIATQMVFSHRFYLNFDLIAIINADALTNMPDFRSEENLFYQIEKLIGFLPDRHTGDQGKILVQTYNPESKLIEKAVSGDYLDFYEKELKLREALCYPPFYRIAKLSFRHKDQNKASYAARIMTEKLKTVITRERLNEKIKIIEATPAYIEKERSLYIYNIFIKFKADYQDIDEILKYIGSGWIVDVEPRSLL